MSSTRLDGVADQAASADPGATVGPTVGEAIVAALEAAGVTHAFGVISLHNMPILDAIARRGRIRFTPARGEAGAVNMADAATRVVGRPAVAVTSTGTGAGNACGALIEAATAGVPMIHLTGQIDTPYLDRGWGFIHEAADQPKLLAAASKAFFRIASAEEAAAVMAQAVETALAAPPGPVSVEIPIDTQKAPSSGAEATAPRVARPAALASAELDGLVGMVRAARRPVLWLGGGARHAAVAAAWLADLGIAVVTSVQGRGIVDEAHPRSLGSFTATPATEALYGRSDLLIVAGSRLRSNETRTYGVALPAPLVRIDADPRARSHAYAVDRFLLGDAAVGLEALADGLARGWTPAADWDAAIAEAAEANETQLRRQIGPYARLMDAVEAALPAKAYWVRDITLSNSLWGNRRPRLDRPGRAIHAAGGGIGQGLAHGVGAAIATGRPVLALVGDGGFMLNPAELATAIEAGIDLVVLLMNDRGYGVIRNIQDADYGGRRAYTDLQAPDFGVLARAFGCHHRRLDDLDAAEAVLIDRFAAGGVSLIEIDMTAIGSFSVAFAGPPVGKG